MKGAPIRSSSATDNGGSRTTRPVIGGKRRNEGLRGSSQTQAKLTSPMEYEALVKQYNEKIESAKKADAEICEILLEDARELGVKIFATIWGK